MRAYNCPTHGEITQFPCPQCLAAPVQHRGSPNPEAPRGPTRRLATAVPTAQVVPDITTLLDDVTTICGNHITQLKAQGLSSPKDAQMLESVAKTLKLVRELDKAVREEIENELAGEDDAALTERLLGAKKEKP